MAMEGAKLPRGGVEISPSSQNSRLVIPVEYRGEKTIAIFSM
jgi:hypothetical protein